MSSLVFPIGVENVKSLNNQGLSYRRKDTIAANFSYSSGTGTTTATLTTSDKFLLEGLNAGASLENEKGSYVAVIDAITTQTGVKMALSCTTNTSGGTANQVTTASTAELRVGSAVTGTGIPSSTTISSITNATTFVLSLIHI